jgi:glycine/D-amino acid oxidase-like deaminating enzyme/nitrite reductase/ring-hydroxylating ferredoxin subunit
MNPEAGKTLSFWAASADVPSFPFLNADMAADVCVIGAGIAGITTAYWLSKANFKVILVDDGPICGGETHRTTAHLSNVIDDRYQVLENEFGTEKTHLVYKSHTAAIDCIEAIIDEEMIDCDFERLDGYLFLGANDKNETLEKELEVCKRIGFTDCELWRSMPLSFFPEIRPTIRFKRQAKFHVVKYLRALARAIVRGGGQIFMGAHALEIEDGKIATVKFANGKRIRAANIVVATNTPISDRVKVHTKQAAYRTYVIAGQVPKGSVPGLYWDTEEPYHYVRTSPMEDDPFHDLLIVGGEDHKTGQEEDKAEECFKRLEIWARRMFPVLADIQYRWSGQVMETVDGLAYIGRDPAHGENVFIATGDSGMGMTHGTLAGLLLTDAIRGIDNPWAELYDPSRKTLQAAMDYVHENLNVVAQYADYVRPSDQDSIAAIMPGEGAVMHHNGEAIAVYRDDNGYTYQCSAVCPHLKALVRWNGVEKTFDCPAHGSRFCGNGEVVNGPAVTGLTALPTNRRIDDTDYGKVPPPTMPSAEQGLPPI